MPLCVHSIAKMYWKSYLDWTGACSDEKENGVKLEESKSQLCSCDENRVGPSLTSCLSDAGGTNFFFFLASTDSKADGKEMTSELVLSENSMVTPLCLKSGFSSTPSWDLNRQTSHFFRFLYYPLSSCLTFLASHLHTDWLLRLWLGNQVGSTNDHLANCYLPSTPKNWSTMRAELTEKLRVTYRICSLK